jgi:hypothetical protein
MQAPALDPVPYPLRREPEREELASRHDTVLPAGQLPRLPAARLVI